MLQKMLRHFEDPTDIYYDDTDSNEYEWDSCTTSDYELDHVFQAFEILDPSFTNLMDINIHVESFHEPDPPKTIDIRAWIESFWDPDNTFSFTLSTTSPSFTNTNDGVSLIYPQLIDWDQ